MVAISSRLPVSIIRHAKPVLVPEPELLRGAWDAETLRAGRGADCSDADVLKQALAQALRSLEHAPVLALHAMRKRLQRTARLALHEGP